MTTARLDVWLWSVRLFKTRSAANKAVSGGHVRLNGSPVKPAHIVKPDDVVTVRQPGWERKFQITQVITKRVGAPIAQTCYIDQSPPKPAYLSSPMARRDPGAGRPTKKDRRDIDRLRGRDAAH
ncbi:RNA-binding S4 domain-containing protein [Tessaracoccus oleiagri]|uniref:Ribosome-associated heat shock protein Hsp15 n=1 Tax=Tessaracoccus oleiagri TaxID=686624 RepID=A0A1G9JWK8_9ACTN|nr:RNA-binding S4 domain-containing protein [Tessaracoccus oleiagri]SDL41253.1 ribosome-associated heat shock protein Hsp15 [Tessaracoccus oleiagri]